MDDERGRDKKDYGQSKEKLSEFKHIERKRKMGANSKWDWTGKVNGKQRQYDTNKKEGTVDDESRTVE